MARARIGYPFYQCLIFVNGGWTVGAGLSYKLSQYFSAGLAYDFIQLNMNNESISCEACGTGVGLGTPVVSGDIITQAWTIRMSYFFNIKDRVWFIVAALCVPITSFAEQPVWTFSPTTATSVVFPVNLTSSIIYTVSNQSSRSHSLVIKPMQGVTQVAPCVLAPKGQAGDSCTLNLSVTGSQLPASGLSGGPVVCQSNNDGSPNPYQCYQPSPGDTLNITVGGAISNGVDWRARGVVTPVKNQGDCDSSYAFSTVGAVEGFYKINSGILNSFSEQQLVDCSANAGCNGGTVPVALEYIINEGGIARESSYPYTARQGACRSVPEVAVNVTSFIQVPPKNEIALAEQVVQQPVSAQISIGTWFEDYTGGIANPDCSADTEYQNVLIVGFTTEYWVIKNSQGSSWGAQGYLYLTRGINACGIANAAYAPS